MATAATTNKTNKPKKAKAKKKKLSTLKLLKTFIILIFVLLLINLFLTIQQQSAQRKALNALVTELHQLKADATTQWQHIEKQISESNTHWTTLTKLESQIPQWQQQGKQSLQSLSKQIEQLQTDLQQQTQKLSAGLQKLGTIKQAASAQTKQGQASQKPRDPGYQATNQYRIFGVEPYGVILVGPKGEFTVARIGRILDKLGEITAISKDRVIAGKYVIKP